MKLNSSPLFEAIQGRAIEQPNRPCLTFLNNDLEPTSYTFGQLARKTTELGQVMARLPLYRSRPIGILLQRQEAQVLHFLAALAAGLTPVILTPPNRKLDKDYYLETTRGVLDQCQFSALITDVAGIDLTGSLLEPFTLQLQKAGRSETIGGDKPSAFLQFSSGTTGIKRGVLISDSKVLDQIRVYAQALDLHVDDRILSWLPLYHDMGLIACLLMPLVQGVHCLMLEPLDWVAKPILYLQGVTRFQATLGWHPNFAFAFMADRVPKENLASLDLRSLRGLVNCSEPVTMESQRRFIQRFASQGLQADVFLGCYAMAETVFALTHGSARDSDYLDPLGPVDAPVPTRGQPFVSVGRPLPGVNLRICNDQGQELPERQIGEIWAQSPFTMAGYYNNPTGTAQVLYDGWYKTGDLGYRVGQACFIRGRKKDLLIVSGVNYFPQDIEDLVSQTDGVRPGRVAAFSEFDPVTQTEKVTILAEADASGDPTIELMVRIRQRLLACFQMAQFSVYIVPAEWLIKSSSGKTARSANKQKWDREKT